MRYTTFGRHTGLRVSQYALGTSNFGTGWGYGAEREEARAISERFVEVDGNFIDTADTYQAGESERLVGDPVRADRDDPVLPPKYGVWAHPERRLSRTSNARKNLRVCIAESLTRLGTDYIDALWVHYPNALTPIDEILRGLDALAGQGKILYAAFSNFPAWRVSRATLLADVSGWAPVARIQLEYSIVERTADREPLPMDEALGLGVALWSPLGSCLLTGKYRKRPLRAPQRLEKTCACRIFRTEVCCGARRDRGGRGGRPHPGASGTCVGEREVPTPRSPISADHRPPQPRPAGRLPGGPRSPPQCPAVRAPRHGKRHRTRRPA